MYQLRRMSRFIPRGIDYLPRGPVMNPGSVVTHAVRTYSMYVQRAQATYKVQRTN